MKLSLDLIAEYTKEAVNILFLKQAEPAVSFYRPLFYTQQECLLSHTLYIAFADRLSQNIRIEKDAALLTIGMPSEAIRKKTENLLVFDASVDIYDAANAIEHVFFCFDLWEQQLLAAEDDSPSLAVFQTFLDVSSDIFENGLSVMNNDFQILFQDAVNIRSGGYHEYGLQRDYSIPPTVVNYFKSDKNYQRISTERDVFYYEGDVLPHRVLCKNIFLNDTFLFRIILTECIRPFRKTDEVLLEYLSTHFVRCLRQLAPQQAFGKEALSRLLCEALDSGKINRQAIESELNKLSWDCRDTFRIACIHAGFGDLFLSTLSYYSFTWMNRFPGTFAFPYQDTLIVVINESKAGSADAYSAQLRLFIRENNFRMGISNFTDDLYKIQTMYRQAETALSIGLSEKPMEWIHWFSKYTLPYIYNLLTHNSELGQLFSPIYYQLERYDKENASSYLETLRVYLQCRMNTVQAAKELYIQRSTMIYRLKRIREIIGKDFEGSEDLLHLYLTFSIVERENERRTQGVNTSTIR